MILKRQAKRWYAIFSVERQAVFPSINTIDSITKEEIVALSQKAHINPNQFKHVKTKGELYKKLNRII